MLSASSPEVRAFAHAFEENQNIGHFGRNLKIIAEDRRKYIAIDEVDKEATPPYHYPHIGHRGGRFLIDRATGYVYTIDGYGKKGRHAGQIEPMTAAYRAATASYNPNSRVMVENRGSMVRNAPHARPGLSVIRGGLARRKPRRTARSWRTRR